MPPDFTDVPSCWDLLDRTLYALRDFDRYPDRGMTGASLTFSPYSPRGWTCRIDWASAEKVEVFDHSRETAVWLAAANAFEAFRRAEDRWAWYSCWTHGEGEGITFKEGLEPPKGVDGSLVSKVNDLCYLVRADSWEEACQVHHRRQGWEPYVPME